MIQGGDPTGTGRGGPGYRFADELPKPGRYELGSLAMANAGPNTNGSQFFITEAPQPPLNGGYTIWGECGNVDVVKAIARVKRDSSDRPVTPVLIQHAIVERVGPAPADAPEAMPTANPPN
jgi:peptidyl-prolyl cis-trans isomerase A (cyclophilin A)